LRQLGRLGILNTNIDMQATTSGNTIFERGNKFFELSNHLGNVLVTISDKRFGVDVAPVDGIIDYYTADVVTANDYYPFGMAMPGRKYTAGSGYRYGFNGKENDKDAGEGVQDYGMRIYDGRLGRFLSVDPITDKYPQLTPYQFASNSPIAGIDLDGLEFYYAADGKLLGRVGKSTEIKIVKKDDVPFAASTFAIIKRGPLSPRHRESFNNLINVSKLLIDKGSLETYSNMDDAAADFGLMNGSISICDNSEYGARIGSVKLEGTSKTVFILGSTVPGYSGDVDISESDLYGTTLAAGVHTHGADPGRIGGIRYNSNSFSGSKIFAEKSLGMYGDMDWANDNHVPLYLANPAGELRIYTPQKYEEGVEEGRVIRTDMPYDRRASRGDVNNQRPAYDFKKILWGPEPRKPNASDAIQYKLPPMIK